MKYTTLNKIRAHSPCAPRWEKLLAHLGKTKPDDEPLPFSVILKSNGLDDAIWAIRSAPEYDREWMMCAVECARDVQHLMPDPRSVAALDVVERYLNGEVTEVELKAPHVAVKAAAYAAAATANAIYAAATASAAASSDAIYSAIYAAGTDNAKQRERFIALIA